MKKLTKIVSAGLSAFMLFSASAFAAGAVSENNCPDTKIITAVTNCNLPQCKNIQSVLEQICPDGKCNFSSLLGLLKNGQPCPGGDCNSDASQGNVISQPETKPQPTPTKPAVPAEQPVKPSTPSSSEFNTAYEDEVIRLVNAERAKYSLSPLQKDEGAASVAHVRAKEIVQSFSHTRPDGSSCFTAAKEQGVTYSTAGENIAYGYADPAQVVNGWMNSEGHRKNILSSSFSKIGVGCYSSGNVLYWSQFFIG